MISISMILSMLYLQIAYGFMQTLGSIALIQLGCKFDFKMYYVEHLSLLLKHWLKRTAPMLDLIAIWLTSCVSLEGIERRR